MGFEPSKEEKQEISRTTWWLLKLILAIAVVILAVGFIIRSCSKIVNAEKAVTNYENFYQLKEQADQVCNDIAIMQNADSISGGFSKQERIIGLENRLNDIIRDYNAKSSAWTKSLWKGKDLPHTLSRRDFNCN